MGRRERRDERCARESCLLQNGTSGRVDNSGAPSSVGAQSSSKPDRGDRLICEVRLLDGIQLAIGVSGVKGKRQSFGGQAVVRQVECQPDLSGEGLNVLLAQVTAPSGKDLLPQNTGSCPAICLLQ